MNPRWPARAVGTFVFWRLVVLSALAGALDVVWNGAELPAVERMQAVVLWAVFGVACALPLVIVSMVLARVWLRPFARAAFWVTLLSVMSVVILLAAVRNGDAPMFGALVAGGAAVVWTRASRRLGNAGGSLGAIAAFCAVIMVAGLSDWLGGWMVPVLIWALAFWVRWRPMIRQGRQVPTPWRVGTHAGLVVAVGIVFAGAAERDVPSGSREGAPDVVMIVLDTMRADHLGAYGGSVSTPTFDRLAGEGIRFDAAFTNAQWTVPSHASLFTGLPARTHGCSFDQHRWLDDEFTTLAEAFGQRGYQTAGFSSNVYLQVANLHQGFEVFEEPGRRLHGLALRRWVQLLGWPARWSDHGARDAIAQVRHYLDVQRDPSAPQFLFVNLLEPHWRHLPALGDRHAHLPEGVGLVEATKISSRFYGPMAMAGRKPEGVVPVLRGLYAAAVEYQDRQLAQLMEVLNERLTLDDAVLVITSDHGENLGEAGRFDHVFAVNDHLVHVPLVIRAPGRVPAGSHDGQLRQLHDVPATLASLIPGLEVLGGGRDLLDSTLPAREYVVIEADPYYGHLDRMSHAAGPQRDIGRFVGSLTAVRDRAHKLVLSTHKAPVLYDMLQDPDEEHDVAAAHAAVIVRLQEWLAIWQERHPVYSGPTLDGAGLTDEQLEQLQAIGY